MKTMPFVSILPLARFGIDQQLSWVADKTLIRRHVEVLGTIDFWQSQSV